AGVGRLDLHLVLWVVDPAHAEQVVRRAAEERDLVVALAAVDLQAAVAMRQVGGRVDEMPDELIVPGAAEQAAESLAGFQDVIIVPAVEVIAVLRAGNEMVVAGAAEDVVLTRAAGDEVIA